MKNKFLNIAKQLQAIAQNGLHYSENDYDTDRYQEIEKLSIQMIHLLSDEKIEQIKLLLTSDDGYRTPKVDVRGIVFNEKNEVLMVQERVDGKWSLPGGWADVGYTPKEIAEKEVWEEAGIKVKGEKLLAIFDKKCHDHPEDINYIYKIFILCKHESGEIKKGMETLDVNYFSKDNLPPLSTPRNTTEQILTMFDLYENKKSEVLFD